MIPGATMGPSEKPESANSYQGRRTRVFGVVLCCLAPVIIALSFWWRNKCETDLRREKRSEVRQENIQADINRMASSRPGYWELVRESKRISRDIEAATGKSENASLIFRLGLSAGGILLVVGAMLFVLPVYLWKRQFRLEKVGPKKRRPAYERYRKNPKYENEDPGST